MTDRPPLENHPTERPLGTDGQLVLVTGMSGAGMSIALKALEDLGYEAVDNLRLSLVPALLEQADPRKRPLALVIDSRTRDFSAHAMLEEVEALKAHTGLDVRLVFLDCGDETLQRRFTETRRRHPLAIDRPVPDGIQLERALLLPLKQQADVTIDTTQLSIHDLRRILAGNFQIGAQAALQVFVTSFSFRMGLPREADLVFDVRFLTNPHYDPELRPLTGLDPHVAARVEEDPDFADFFRHLTDLLQPLLPRYNQEGKSYLTIAVGCTGGKHRSVFVAERLAAWLTGLGLKVGISHRELDRQAQRTG
ncbi:RNase adapter RapZ [Azospirillum brasilense]|uniref:RNase adapter RapZ n=1 Tax=Azospirillum brasilense TaxID=192 RepID=A0A0P0EKG3_AZOBR|nr:MULTISPECIES: RNase adapter RapZ [Azospirillum]ALJ38444.1 nucleotide-binding protein [Azospirillum brasilense]MDW7553090.1 RNase adapter RapZ [Azospirillum brasilense]MDW7593532.1 RNase adapter RapZ [Azospirillum brasilense]MDW7628409.1 RNase adapter RapZ [Azospirillum brasilense]MDX5955496.1 RNase adapter RapZ [Azospirillum brasilense]